MIDVGKKSDFIFMEQIRLCEKALLNVSEMMAYTGWGENTVRDELNHPRCSYVIRKV